ncbi:MAG: hypothetical protein AAGG48_27075 [Planctomycetota bacterium]
MTRKRRRSKLRWVCAAIAIGCCPAFTSTVLAQTHVQRLGRLSGFGWGDGYHASQSSGTRPWADLPPRLPAPKRHGLPMPGKMAGQMGSTFYDHFDAGARVHPTFQSPFHSFNGSGGACDTKTCDTKTCDTAPCDTAPCDAPSCDTAPFDAPAFDSGPMQINEMSAPPEIMPAPREAIDPYQLSSPLLEQAKSDAASEPFSTRPFPTRPTPPEIVRHDREAPAYERTVPHSVFDDAPAVASSPSTTPRGIQLNPLFNEPTSPTANETASSTESDVASTTGTESAPIPSYARVPSAMPSIERPDHSKEAVVSMPLPGFDSVNRLDSGSFEDAVRDLSSSAGMRMPSLEPGMKLGATMADQTSPAGSFGVFAQNPGVDPESPVANGMPETHSGLSVSPPINTPSPLRISPPISASSEQAGSPAIQVSRPVDAVSPVIGEEKTHEVLDRVASQTAEARVIVPGAASQSTRRLYPSRLGNASVAETSSLTVNAPATLPQRVRSQPVPVSSGGAVRTNPLFTQPAAEVAAEASDPQGVNENQFVR